MESEYFSDIEKEKLAMFMDDTILKEAVKKALVKYLYHDGVLFPDKPAKPLSNFALNVYKGDSSEMYSDEELGKLTKLRRLSIELVENAYKDLAQYKRVTPKEEKTGEKYV